jgi:type III secretion protein R
MLKTLKVTLCLIIALGVFWISPQDLFGQNQVRQARPSVVIIGDDPAEEQEELSPAELLQRDVETDPFVRPTIVTQAVVLTALSVMPFVIMILTSFLKIVIVLSLLRSALGVQQAPPNQVINGVAFMLSLFVMYPTGLRMYEASQVAIERAAQQEELFTPETSVYFMEIANEASGPLKDFIQRNSSATHQALFFRMAYRIVPPEFREGLSPDDFIILVPAYITSQLKEAFQIGVLIYIPFFVIDLTTSNILLAMGMMMLSPVTISMPLKLFLLVMLDGWTLLVEGLVQTFR